MLKIVPSGRTWGILNKKRKPLVQTTTNLKLFKVLTFLVQKVHSHLVLGTLVLSTLANTMLVI